MRDSRGPAKPAQTRGREARLRTEFGYLYPGLEAGVWTPVEVLINRVVTLLYGDPSNSGRITGAGSCGRTTSSSAAPPRGRRGGPSGSPG